MDNLTQEQITNAITKLEETIAILKSLQDGIVTNRKVVIEIMRYISGSGNETWKCNCEDGSTLWLRQSQKDMLIDAKIWSWLNTRDMDDWYHCRLEVDTVPDGDFIKVVSIGKFDPYHNIQISPSGKLDDTSGNDGLE